MTAQAETGRIGLHWVDAIMTAYSGNATSALVPQSTNTGVLSLGISFGNEIFIKLHKFP